MSFLFSGVLVIGWLTRCVELWQLTLNTPWANRDNLPLWADAVQDILRVLVFDGDAHRLTLGLVYALPLLLTPHLLKLTGQVRQDRLIRYVIYATLLNLDFFWIQLGAEYLLRGLSLKIPIQAIILWVSYGAVLYALINFRDTDFKISKLSYNKAR